MTISKKELKEYFDWALNITHEAGRILLKGEKESEIEVVSKGQNDVYSTVDKKSESFFLKKISSKFPTHSFLSEEISFAAKEKKFEKYSKNEFTWILDPLDGTHNYLNGLPFYCISLAFQHYEETLFGIVYAPKINETFYAIKGEGSKYRSCHSKVFKKVIFQNFKDKIQDSLIISSPSKTYPQENNFFNKIQKKCRSTRKFGSLALELCYIGLGRIDGVYKFHTYPWDIAAGILFLQELGLSISNGREKKFSPFKKELLIANKYLYPKLLKFID